MDAEVADAVIRQPVTPTHAHDREWTAHVRSAWSRITANEFHPIEYPGKMRARDAIHLESLRREKLTEREASVQALQRLSLRA